MTASAVPRRFGMLWRSLYVAAGFLIVAGNVVQTAVFTDRLLTPVDVGGAVFGGAMGFAEDSAGWTIAMVGVVLSVLLRLPGFRLAWIAAGGLPVAIGALALWHYPDDPGGYLIFSPRRSEIGLALMLGGALLTLGAVLHWRITVPRLSSRWMRALLMTLRLLAMAGMAVVYIGLPVIRLIDGMQPPPPPCAHDEAGRQLTLCLKPYDPTGDATR
jgi:hypothetical protein